MDDRAFLIKLIGMAYPSGPMRIKLLTAVQWAKPDEVAILADVMRIKDAQRGLREILSGAHVTIFDQGKRYDRWRVLPTAQTRRSSHRSDGPQYHVDGPFTHTILFGVHGGYTWLQLENHSTGVRQFPGHMLDWLKYSVFKENQGPYGSSKHVDNRPLRYIPVEPKPRVVVQQHVFR